MPYRHSKILFVDGHREFACPNRQGTMVECQAIFVNVLWHLEGQRASVYQGFVAVRSIGNGV